LSQPIQAPYQQYGPPPGYPLPKKGAGLAIASMVLGIIALLLSWVPIINNFAAVLAVVGLGLGVPAFLRARRGTHGGTGMSITGLVTSIVAIVVVIATQAFYSEVIDEVEREINEGVAGVASASPSAPSAEAAVDVDDAAETVALGVPAQVGDYEVTVDAVELDANASVAAANEFNEPPTGQYVVTQLTVTYTGATEGLPGFDLTAVFHGSDARQYSDSECSAYLADDAIDAPTLNPGGSDTFQFCMDVPPTAIAGGQLSVEPTVSLSQDERVFFALA
jgi:hypothetical protein